MSCFVYVCMSRCAELSLPEVEFPRLVIPVVPSFRALPLKVRQPTLTRTQRIALQQAQAIDKEHKHTHTYGHAQIPAGFNSSDSVPGVGVPLEDGPLSVSCSLLEIGRRLGLTLSCLPLSGSGFDDAIYSLCPKGTFKRMWKRMREDTIMEGIQDFEQTLVQQSIITQAQVITKNKQRMDRETREAQERPRQREKPQAYQAGLHSIPIAPDCSVSSSTVRLSYSSSLLDPDPFVSSFSSSSPSLDSPSGPHSAASRQECHHDHDHWSTDLTVPATTHTARHMPSFILSPTRTVLPSLSSSSTVVSHSNPESVRTLVTIESTCRSDRVPQSRLARGDSVGTRDECKPDTTTQAAVA